MADHSLGTYNRFELRAQPVRGLRQDFFESAERGAAAEFSRHFIRIPIMAVAA